MLCGVPLFALTVITLIPDDFAQGVLRRAVERKTGMTFSAKDFKKILPSGFEASGMTVSSANNGREIIYFDRFRARLDVLSLLSGHPVMDVDAFVGQGRFNSTVTSMKNALDFTVSADGIDAAAIPGLSFMELKGPVKITGKARLVTDDGVPCPAGSLELKGTGVDLNLPATAVLSSFFKDKAGFDLAMTIDAKDCRARIKGLWLDSADTALKLYGDVLVSKEIMQSGLDLTVEISLKKGDAEGTPLAYMPRYRRSSNFYSMRLKGTIGNPQIVE